jgi:hypothetical protein
VPLEHDLLIKKSSSSRSSTVLFFAIGPNPNNDLFVNLPSTKFIVCRDGPISVLTVDTATSLVTVSGDFVANNIGIKTQADSAYALNINGNINISNYYSSIVFNKSALAIGPNPNNDLFVNLPSTKFIVCRNGPISVLTVDIATSLVTVSGDLLVNNIGVGVGTSPNYNINTPRANITTLNCRNSSTTNASINGLFYNNKQ